MKTKEVLIDMVCASLVSVIILWVGYIVIQNVNESFELCKIHPNENVTTKYGNVSCDGEGKPIMELASTKWIWLGIEVGTVLYMEGDRDEINN